MKIPNCLLLAALNLAIANCCLAQTSTNAAPAEFQGFRPGDIVHVQVRAPLIVLGQALFQSQSPSNIVVLSQGERYVLVKSAVVLSPPVNFARLAQASPGTAPAGEPSLATPDAQLLMMGVQQKILGGSSGEKGFDVAEKYYQETMKSYLGGQTSLADIVAQAERVLKEVDQYQPERAKDPQYEGQISYLRAFVERAKAGETGPGRTPP
jgi:hypothetical protein